MCVEKSIECKAFGRLPSKKDGNARTCLRIQGKKKLVTHNFRLSSFRFYICSHSITFIRGRKATTPTPTKQTTGKFFHSYLYAVIMLITFYNSQLFRRTAQTHIWMWHGVDWSGMVWCSVESIVSKLPKNSFA